jgi:shikimate dehydrogenase
MFRCGVIGSPVGHSLSPRLHMAAMNHLAIFGESVIVEDDGNNPDRLTSTTHDFDALSVTFPLKDRMYELCDEVDDLARQVGAVNSVRCVDTRIVGRNVDGEGFCRAIISELDVDVRDASVTVIGAGGAARSIIASLLSRGVGRIDVLLRSDRGQLSIFGSDERVRGVSISSYEADLVINATPVSLTGDSSELPAVAAGSQSAFIDLSYEPAETAWMAEQRLISSRVANGKMMLVWQAKLQLDWWFDADIPISVLREAVAQ